MTARLISNKSTSQSLEHPVLEKAESDIDTSQESGRGLDSSLVGVNSASNLSHNIP